MKPPANYCYLFFYNKQYKKLEEPLYIVYNDLSGFLYALFVCASVPVAVYATFIAQMLHTVRIQTRKVYLLLADYRLYF